MQKEVFQVDGLDCASEVRVLTDRVSRMPGIGDLSFDVINGQMTATFDPASTSARQIVAAIAETGMSARLVARSLPVVDVHSGSKDRGRLLATLLSATFLLSGFVAHAVVAGSLVEAFHPVEGSGLGSGAGGWLIRVLYGVAIVAGGWSVVPKAWFALRRRVADMNLLMCIAVAGAVILGDWFEAATITCLFSLALLLEQASMRRAQRAIAALLSITPLTAHRRVPGTDRVEDVAVASVVPGDRLDVRPHERIPLDGRVVAGSSDVDQSPITGESLPVPKSIDDEVFAGSINHDGLLEIVATKSADSTILARIVERVRTAAAHRAPTEQWIDKFSARYTPAMTLLALAFALLPPLFVGHFADWAYRGLVLLVIACPCALVISTPVTILSAIASATRQGVLVKGGRSLETCVRLAAVALDKTGTLTAGHPAVQRIVPLNGHSNSELIQRAAALESHSTHPLARAVMRAAVEEGLPLTAAGDYRSLQGRGGQGTFDGRTFWIGSHRLMHELEAETPDVHDLATALEDAGHSIIAVGNDNHICGLISVADEVRTDAADVLARLRRLGVRHVAMLTGDNEKTAAAVAASVGVDSYHANLLPDDKVREVVALRERFGPVAMIGDGVNDAPAMAAADVAIAMAAMGSDAAVETADIALMSDQLAKVPWLIGHARRTLRIVKCNVAFALGLKIAFLLLSCLGLASLWAAIAADTGASLLVIANGLRLLKAGRSWSIYR